MFDVSSRSPEVVRAQKSRDNGKRKALIIAVSEYDKQSKLNQLPFCKKDGEAVSSVLKDQYEIPDKWCLIGNVEGQRIKDAIYDFFRESAKEDDTLFFYFSGHGVHDNYGDTFLASSNIDKKFIDRNGYNFSYLENEAIRKTPARNVVVALDCCLAGAAELGKSGEDEAAKAKGNMEKIFKEGSGKCILASSLDGQSSYKMNDQDYSIFTWFLLEGLKGGNGMAVDENGYVTPSKLSNYVYNAIPLDRQKPITKIAQSGDIIIASYPELKSDQFMTVFMKSARESILHGDYNNAMKFLTNVLERNPKNADAMYAKGTVLLKLRKYDDAIRCFDQTLAINSKLVEAQSNIRQILEKEEYKSSIEGMRLLEIDQFENALEYFNRALAIDPNYTEAWIGKGSALHQLKNYHEAIDYLDKALAVDPTDKRLVMQKGIALYRLLEDSAALEYFNRALAIDPNYTEALIGKGSALHQLKNYHEAIKYLDKAISIDKNNPNAWLAKAFSLRRLEDYERAIECLDKVISFDQNFFEAWIQKAWCLNSLGRSEDSKECSRKAKDLKKNQLTAAKSPGVTNSSRAKRKALIIGIGDYDSIHPLPSSINDGRLMIDFLEDQGYEIRNSSKLVGRVHAMSMRQSIFDFFIDNVKPEDMLLFYYSGQAAPDESGNHFLIPSDIEPQLHHLLSKGFNFSDLETAIRLCPAKRIVLFLDTSHSGALKVDSMGFHSAVVDDDISELDEKPKDYKENYETDQGIYLLAASAAAGQGYSSPSYGIFTHFLLEGLRGAGGETVTKNGYVTTNTLGKYVYDKVVKVTSGRQRPFVKTAAVGEIVLTEYPELLERLSKLRP